MQVPDFRNSFPEEIFRMSCMGKAVFAVAASVLAAGSVLGAGAADAANNKWAAIAFSSEQWESWSTRDWPTEEEATSTVLQDCGMQDCQILTSWANGCGALVWNDQGWVAAASGPTRSEAVRKAIDRLSDGVPIARLANFGSSDFSGTKVVEVFCTSNVRG
ncbi:DUF4189 domain-containing protein [Nocardia fluminea]|uniref:DUF4189 domain-containing protein n=1 Tax=Nocardia fluminea TaxID=134984 RepID=UPI0033F5E232